MGKVENIGDYFALSCECGSVNFHLLKSGNIECSYCGSREHGNWLDRRVESEKLNDLVGFACREKKACEAIPMFPVLNRDRKSNKCLIGAYYKIDGRNLCRCHAKAYLKGKLVKFTEAT